MAGYTRTDTVNNIATGNVINASDLDNEYNAVEAAFNATTGHTHGGAASEGAPITRIGPVQDIVVSGSAAIPKTDNTMDLGSAALEFKDLYIDGIANIDSLIADTADINGGTVDATTVGATTPATGAFTTLSTSSTTTLSGLTASTALALDASKVIVSVTNTGTGNNVLATSPTLVTPALGTPSSGTVTNLTGTASININGTVGATTASTGAFTTLTTSSTVTLNGGTANGVAFLNGSKVLTTGSALTFDGTNINLTGSSGLFNALLGAGFRLQNSVPSANWNLATSGLDLQTRTSQAGSLLWLISDSEQMRLTSTGLGIGTSSPTSKLTVFVADAAQSAGFHATNGRVRFRPYVDATSGAIIDATNVAESAYGVMTIQASTLRLFGNNALGATIDSSGNVGIGTSSPNTNLEISTTVDPILRLNNSTNAVTAGADIGEIQFYTNDASTNGTGVKAFVKTVAQAFGSAQGGADLVFGTAAFAVGDASEKMRIDKDGNVGIGTSSPSSGYKLDVNGQIIMSTAGASKLAWGYSGQYLNWIECDGVAGNNFMRFATGNAEMMRITSAGNVGIGTSAPPNRLAVVSAAAGDAISWTNGGPTPKAGFFYSDSNVAAIFNTANANVGRVGIQMATGVLSFDTAATERMRIDSSGNVGIGVTPSAWLSTTKAIQLPTGSLFSPNNGSLGLAANVFTDGATTNRYVANGSATYHDQTNGTFRWFTAPSGTAGNAITFTQAMTLDSSGKLLVGSTTSVQGSRLEVTSNALAPALLARVNAASDEAQWAVQAQKTTTTNTTAQVFVRFLINDGATASGLITANGANQATFTSTSDERLKENIVDLPSQLKNITALRPVEFDYRDGSGHQIGFIAQEMQEVYPDSVSENSNGMLQIGGWSKTEARLVKAIQEQQALIEALTTRLTTLENK